MSMKRLAEVRKVKSQSMDHMLSKLLTLYLQQSNQCFQGQNHMNIVTDGSCHSCKDMLLSICYSLNMDACCHMVGQVIYPSKVVAANEDIDVSLEIERILARREQERLSSYKLLQALSHQIHLLSNGRLCLDSFRSPVDLALPLCRLNAGGHRSFDSEGNVSICLSRHDEPKQFSLGSYCDMPILTVMQDQGPCGMAAASFLKSERMNVMMVHMSWDKIHRLINDMKHAGEHTSSSELLQSQAASTYVFSVNYKPFSSGSFFEEKKAAMEGFFGSVSLDPHLN